MKLKQYLQRGVTATSLLVLLGSSVMPLARAAEPVVSANGPFNIIVSPPSLGLTTTPGKPVTTDIKIRNQGLATEHIKVTLMKFGANGQDGTPSITDITPADEFGKWATLSKTRIDAETNVWQNVSLTVSPPKDAAFGYYYAVVFSREGANIPKSTKANTLLGAVASLILLDVKSPNAVRKVKIDQFSIDHKVHEFLPVTFNVRMHNVGNTHVSARGNIDIFKGKKNLGIIEVNEHKGYILPQTYRVFPNKWADGSPVYQDKIADGKVVLDKKNKQVTQLNYDKFSLSKLRFGKYTAKLVMVYDDGQGDVSTEANVDFWVIPWRILAVLLVLLLMFGTTLWILLIRPLRRRITRNKVHSAPRS